MNKLADTYVDLVVNNLNVWAGLLNGELNYHGYLFATIVYDCRSCKNMHKNLISCVHLSVY